MKPSAVDRSLSNTSRCAALLPLRSTALAVATGVVVRPNSRTSAAVKMCRSSFGVRLRTSSQPERRFLARLYGFDQQCRGWTEPCRRNETLKRMLKTPVNHARSEEHFERGHSVTSEKH